MKKSGAVSQKAHRDYGESEKSWKFEKTAPRIKAAGNRPQDPILAGKNTSRAFQRLFWITLKVPELREKWIFLSPAIDFFRENGHKKSGRKCSWGSITFCRVDLFSRKTFFWKALENPLKGLERSIWVWGGRFLAYDSVKRVLTESADHSQPL